MKPLAEALRRIAAVEVVYGDSGGDRATILNMQAIARVALAAYDAQPREERQRFEAWEREEYAHERPTFEKDGDGDYLDGRTQIDWTVWRAALSADAQPQDVPINPAPTKEEAAAWQAAQPQVPQPLLPTELFMLAQDAGFVVNLTGQIVPPAPHENCTKQLIKFAELVAARGAQPQESGK